VSSVVGGLVDTDLENRIAQSMLQFEFIPGGRYLRNAGFSNVFSNCMVFGSQNIDSIEQWGQDVSDTLIALKRGTGVGLNGTNIRPEGSPIGNDETERAGGPMSYFDVIHSTAKALRKQRRAALMFLLSASHPDVLDFINAKALTPQQIEARNKDYTYETPFNMANFSVVIDKDFQNHLANGEPDALQLFDLIMANAVKYGEPGIVVERVGGETLTNVCGEFKSGTDRAICNLASVNMAAINNPAKMREVSKLATVFLMCGMIRTGLPIPTAIIEDIGLGLMGLHSHLIKRGMRYEPNAHIERMLSAWANGCEDGVRIGYHITGIDPVHTRAIAPTGTISYLTHLGGIQTIATPGIEPLFAAAYERRHYDSVGNVTKSVVIDPLVAQLDKDTQGQVQDTYCISVADRLDMLAYVQNFVGSGGISTTINLPACINDEKRGELIKGLIPLVKQYLPRISGLTFYEDGSRGLSPLTRLSIDDVYQQNVNSSNSDVALAEDLDNVCRSGMCGI
jgi:ribonucleoside-diphosphate reductase alpha chain